jgi:uncharacterized membrane protein YfcA
MDLVPIMDTDLLEIAVLWTAVLFAAVLRSFTGFGFAIAAMPAFALFLSPGDAVVLSTSLTLAISLIGLRSYWGQVPLRPMLPLVPACVLGTAAGVALLAVITPVLFQLGVGLAVIGACIALSFTRPRQREAGGALGWVVGLFSGVMNGVLAMPGPPVIVYAMSTELQPERSRALLMSFFLAASLLALVFFAAAGLVGARSGWYFLMALPALIVGDRLGLAMFRRHGAALYRHVALGALAAIGVATTLRALLLV